MRIIILATGFCLCVGALLSAQAEVTMAPLFKDSMILQREMPVPVWGKAAPDESVTVAFGGQQASTKADATGHWKVVLKSMPANATPQEMTITGTGQPIVIKDVLIGEVWLCSGQSNMGLEVRKSLNVSNDIASANYRDIRCFMVSATPSTNQGYPIFGDSQHYALTPQETCQGVWHVTTPINVINWSAVGYFFARNLHEQLHVPIGIIVASYGATAIEAFISVDGLKAIPGYRARAEAFDVLAREYIANTNSYPGSLEAEKSRLAEQNKVWFKKLDDEESGLKNNWQSPTLDTANWNPINLPVYSTNNPIGEVKAAVWFRKDVAIPAAWIGKNLELHLGVVDSVDESYVNGTRVGRTWFDASNYWSVARVYPVPASAATSTNVSLSLRLVKLAYPMAVFGPATDMKLVLSSDTNALVSLAGEWRMKKSLDIEPGDQPREAPLLHHPPGNYYGHPGAQYNGQIHPLAPYAIRGAIWYQGEANAPFYADYPGLMRGLITSWRKEWGYDFAFGIIQLADYQGQQTKPVERTGYHLIREAQAMAMNLTNTFLATAVGIGEGADIHPKRKQEAGRRLAWSALGSVYGLKDRPYNGPMYKSMEIIDSKSDSPETEVAKIRLHFDSNARGLHAESDPPVGFAIAGADRTYYFAKAKIEGETVVVWSDKVPHPIAVRYAWAYNPVCNLANSENLPLFQFRTDNWDQSQVVIPDDDTIIIPTGWVPK